MPAPWVMSNILHPEWMPCSEEHLMKLSTKIVSIAVAATALCGVGLGTASAVTPAAATQHASVSSKDVPATKYVAYQATLDSLQSVSLPAFSCPVDQPYLVNKTFDDTRGVPNGVVVDEPGGVGVTIGIVDYDGSNGLVTGWDSGRGSATNWALHQNSLTISAFCTAEAAGGYHY